VEIPHAAFAALASSAMFHARRFKGEKGLARVSLQALSVAAKTSHATGMAVAAQLAKIPLVGLDVPQVEIPHAAFAALARTAIFHAHQFLVQPQLHQSALALKSRASMTRLASAAGLAATLLAILCAAFVGLVTTLQLNAPVWFQREAKRSLSASAQWTMRSAKGARTPSRWHSPCNCPWKRLRHRG